ncbi:hypothetical protein Ciccas_004617 [Cichlidogyrus casuarinus]|uniref:C2H2-type domain-containing protein n=1 Tax=Cichlidogyrus casuarinus TaxID=1844966 RepID=A0ABD2QAZ5_9PLAT
MNEYQPIHHYPYCNYPSDVYDRSFYEWYPPNIPYYPPNPQEMTYLTHGNSFHQYTVENHSFNYENCPQEYYYPIESYPYTPAVGQFNYVDPQHDASYMYGYPSSTIPTSYVPSSTQYNSTYVECIGPTNEAASEDYQSANRVTTELQPTYQQVDLLFRFFKGEFHAEPAASDKFIELWCSSSKPQEALVEASTTNPELQTPTAKPLKKPVFQCPKCSKSFSRYGHLENHKRIHIDYRPHFCKICARRFTQRSNLMRHMSVHKLWPFFRKSTSISHKSAKFKTISTAVRKYKKICPGKVRPGVSFECRFCGEFFDRISEVRSHLVVHNDKQLYFCLFPYCAASFRSLEAFLNHLDFAHPDNSTQTSFSCFRCDKRYHNLAELLEHHEQFPEHQSYYRSYKRKTVDNAEELQTPKEPAFLEALISEDSQQMPEVEQDQLTVPAQPKKSTPPTDDNLNLLLFTNEKPIKRCKVCLRAFGSHGRLRKHTLTAHPQSTALMLQHLKASVDEKSLLFKKDQNFEFRCTTCGKGYLKKACFEQHAKLCKITEMEIKEKLKQFRRVHGARTPYSQLKPVEKGTALENTSTTRSGRGVHKVDYSQFGAKRRRFRK